MTRFNNTFAALAAFAFSALLFFVTITVPAAGSDAVLAAPFLA